MTYSAFDPSFTGWVVARTAVSRVDRQRRLNETDVWKSLSRFTLRACTDVTNLRVRLARVSRFGIHVRMIRVKSFLMTPYTVLRE